MTVPEKFPAGVRAVLAQLAAVPYENLSKIVARHRKGNPESALDFSCFRPGDPLRPHWGGTCFALTHWLKIRMDELNQSTAYLMAGKPQSADIHCGLLWEYAGGLYLLDPGYLLFDPLPLPENGGQAFASAPPHAIRLEDQVEAGLWRLFTGPESGLKYRFDFRKEPVGDAEFQRHWEASFTWPMMRYPVLNRVENGVQFYLQRNNLLVRTAAESTMRRLTGDEVAATAESTFGLPRPLVQEALALLYGGGATNPMRPPR